MPSYNQEAINLIWNELSSRGVKPEVAAGAIAGIMGESGPNIDPLSFNAKDPGGGAGGILQWRADRLIGDHGLLAFAKANGRSMSTRTRPPTARKYPWRSKPSSWGMNSTRNIQGFSRVCQSVNNGEEGPNHLGRQHGGSRQASGSHRPASSIHRAGQRPARQACTRGKREHRKCWRADTIRLSAPFAAGGDGFEPSARRWPVWAKA